MDIDLESFKTMADLAPFNVLPETERDGGLWPLWSMFAFEGAHYAVEWLSRPDQLPRREAIDRYFYGMLSVLAENTGALPNDPTERDAKQWFERGFDWLVVLYDNCARLDAIHSTCAYPVSDSRLFH